MVLHTHEPAFQVAVTRSGPDQVLTPVGELDLATVEVLQDAAAAAAARAEGKITLDLGKLSFADVTGVRAVLTISRLLGARLLVRPASPGVQRVFELTGAAAELPLPIPANVRAFPSAAERNLKYVRRIWQAFMDRGIDGLAKLVPAEVQWVPWEAHGQVLRGTSQLREFYAGPRAGKGSIASEFRSVGEDVLVHSSFLIVGGIEKRIFALYHFDGGTLVRQTSFDDEAQALAATA